MSVIPLHHDIEYPESDGQPMAESDPCSIRWGTTWLPAFRASALSTGAMSGSCRGPAPWRAGRQG